MARAFDQIYAELGSAFDPSAQIVQQQIAAIPGSTDALVAQADAKKDLAFNQITDGARRRGMGFSGIPLAEQAVYASTEYAPAIANVKSQAENRRVSLLESLNGINRDRRTQAQGIYDNEQARDFQERQFQESIRQYNETLAEQRRQAAATAAASGGADLSAYLGGGAGAANDPMGAVKQGAYEAVSAMMQRRNTKSFLQEVQAISKSASYGNVMDQAKLELLRSQQPGLFSGGKLNTKRIDQLMGSFQ